MRKILLYLAVSLLGSLATADNEPASAAAQNANVNEAGVAIEMRANTSYNSGGDEKIVGGQICTLPTCHPEATSTARQQANRKDRQRDSSNPSQTESK